MFSFIVRVVSKLRPIYFFELALMAVSTYIRPCCRISFHSCGIHLSILFISPIPAKRRIMVEWLIFI